MKALAAINPYRLKQLIIRTIYCFIRILLLASLLPLGISSVQAATAKYLTLVSLTFDDGLVQSPVRNILLNHNMKGTFYINSGNVGKPGWLTKAEIDDLYADGNEIGGHTVNHPDLATLSDANQKTEICNDRQALINMGYQIYSFAYPYSSTGPTTESIVAAGCGSAGTYESARAVGGLTNQYCPNCPYAGSIVPGDRYHISAQYSFDSTTTLEQMKSYIIQAETNGGGWVNLVFHRICDNCGAYSVNPQMLDDLLTWLQTRTSNGTYVRKVHQVMTGDYPPPPPPPPVGVNVLKNTSLELDADVNGVPDCWKSTSWGVNNPAWSRTSQAHTGNFGEQLSMSNYSSGDSKLLTELYNNSCLSTVLATDYYQVSAWYKSSVSTPLVLFYRDTAGNWQYWRDGPLLPATTTWQQVVVYPGTVPTGANAISFGLALEQNGTVITDDYSMALVLDSPADTTSPQISAVTPATNAIVSGNVALSATVSDNVAVQSVDFLINGAVVATDTTSPYQATWNSTLISNGVAAYTVNAKDSSGNLAVSTANYLTVANGDTIAPTVGFTQPPTPVNGATVSGTVNLAATASDNVAVTRVDFLVNNTVVQSVTTAPYSYSWNTTSIANGAATLVAKAYDAAGNNASTAAVNVTVSNIIADTTTPTVAFTQPPTPVNGATVSGTVSLAATASDNVAVTRVDFLVNNSVVQSVTTAPYSYSWSSSTVTNGAATLVAKAYDAAGNNASTATVSVTINNTATGNLVLNPSLETDADANNQADCWTRAGYGTNTPTWTRLTGAANAHSGNFAEQLTIASWTNGDRKLINTQDAGTCAQTVTAGAKYKLSAWYKSTTSTAIVIYYRSSTGVWTYWTSSPFAASSAWGQATLTTAAVPTGATAISFGLALGGMGTLITDDYSMTLAP